MIRLATLVPVVLAAACGGGAKQAPTTTTTPTAGSAEHPGEHQKLTPELDAFHATLSPRWHAEAGPQRMKDACAAVPELQTQAGAIKAAAAPAGVDGTAWTTTAGNLEASLAGLSTACGTGDQAQFDAAFTKVHDAFHGQMALVVGDHEPGHGAGGGHGKGHGSEHHH